MVLDAWACQGQRTFAENVVKVDLSMGEEIVRICIGKTMVLGVKSKICIRRKMFLGAWACQGQRTFAENDLKVELSMGEENIRI